MAKLLILYATKQGQAKKIADVICSQLQMDGHDCEMFNIESLPISFSLSDYDAVIIGASVHVKSYSSILRKWISKNILELRKKPTAFYSVCLGVVQNNPEVDKDLKNILFTFFDATSWTPSIYTIFAGALPYSKYNWFMKRIMRSIAKKAGVKTDINRDYEYTNWDDVKNFAQEFGINTKSK